MKMINKNNIQIITTQVNTDIQVISMFLYQKARRSDSTRIVYEHEIKRFFNVIDKSIQKINLVDLQDYQRHLESLSLSNATQCKALSVIRSLFTFARKIGYIRFNPSEVLDLPKIAVNSDSNFLTKQEAIDLLEALKPNTRDYLIGALALKTGLRVSEIKDIKWCDFFSDLNGKIGLKIIGKGTKARAVKITPDLWNLIQRYRKESYKPSDLDDSNNGPLFLNRYGQSMSSVSIWKVIKKGAKKANIKKRVTPHWLRHTFGTLSILGGATLSQVKKALGHSDIRTTQRYEHSAMALVDTASDHIPLTV
jgi:site-specific recombinase XerD